MASCPVCPYDFAFCWEIPAKTVLMIVLPAETLGRKQNHADRLGRKPFFKYSRLNTNQEIADSLGGSQIWWTVSTDSKIGGLVYTLWYILEITFQTHPENTGLKIYFHMHKVRFVMMWLKIHWKLLANWDKFSDNTAEILSHHWCTCP